ncbi:hypothetical protein Pan241w_60990 [Gimesia alba]|uniref:Uncharacterized protein n=1 Tax=Gimesia alba TaxID=2527973 RepID=A0A517RQ19_9PLAN|nr:hypothetical protein [Gimesia alba]QDT45971.1 hypothetical protein Pan241w_60990 [Gimesia alba]
MKSFSEQFLHDLRASWQKTLLLGLLFIVGLYFWVPPLYRAIRGTSAPTIVPAKINQAVVPQRPPVETEMSFTQSEAQDEPRHSWEQFDSLMQTDPLVQSVQMGAVQKNPFKVNRDQFSPPILFAEEPVQPKTELTEKKPKEVLVLPDGIVLKTTIIGKFRRAAIINNKMYYEGKTFEHENVTYTLEQVAARNVILKQGEQKFELKIQNDPSAFIKFAQ